MARTSTTVLAVAIFGVLAVIGQVSATAKIVCYYDTRTLEREGAGKIEPIDIEPALPLCTHLLYGYAVIDGNNNQLTPRDVYIDEDAPHKGYYKKVTGLKARHPGLRVLLSVGGGADQAGEKTKYLTILETPESRAAFVQSARALLKKYNFDGLDLAWQFPQIKEKRDRGTFGNIWHKVKKTFSGSTKDDKEEEHRDGFTALVRELRQALRGDGYMLSLGVLPHVNSTIYYDYRVIAPLVDQIHLLSADFVTPERVPQEADYSSPLFYVHDRKSYQNVDSFVRRWLENGVDAFKLIVGVPTFGRSWALTSDSAISGVPPIVSDGPGEQGSVTKTPGLLAWQETCLLLKTGDKSRDGPERTLRKVTDPSKRLGSYGFKAYMKDAPGLWVSYEDPDTAAYKSAYVKGKQLGGIALLDLSLDDPRGVCGSGEFPILKAAKNGL